MFSLCAAPFFFFYFVHGSPDWDQHSRAGRPGCAHGSGATNALFGGTCLPFFVLLFHFLGGCPACIRGSGCVPDWGILGVPMAVVLPTHSLEVRACPAFFFPSFPNGSCLPCVRTLLLVCPG